MKTFITLALFAFSIIASAQPGHGKKYGKGHYKKHQKHKIKHYHKNDYKHAKHMVKADKKRNYHYRVAREMAKYNFLRLSPMQRHRLQASLNYLILKEYGPRAYEHHLRQNLRNILSRSQYNLWQKRAYPNGGTTFVFHFNR